MTNAFPSAFHLIFNSRQQQIQKRRTTTYYFIDRSIDTRICVMICKARGRTEFKHRFFNSPLNITDTGVSHLNFKKKSSEKTNNCANSPYAMQNMLDSKAAVKSSRFI